MSLRESFRDRDPTEVAVLEALVDRAEDGMTVLEIRGRVDADIDDIEAALAQLKREQLIEVTDCDHNGGDALIYPADRVLATPGKPPEETWLDRLLGRLSP